MDKTTRKKERHIHTWLLPSPNGPLADGVCDCGSQMSFPNTDERSMWARFNNNAKERQDDIQK